MIYHALIIFGEFLHRVGYSLVQKNVYMYKVAHCQFQSFFRYSKSRKQGPAEHQILLFLVGGNKNSTDGSKT